MNAQQAAWEQLPRELQQLILVLAGSPFSRRVSKGWRDAFDATNDMLCFSYDSGQRLEVAATAAATRVVKNSASLTAVNLKQGLYAPPPLNLSDLLAAGTTADLAARLRKLTGIRVTATCAVQQLQALRQCTGLTHLDISGSDLEDCLAVELSAVLKAMPRLTHLHMCNCMLQSQHVVAAFASALQSLTQLQHLHLAESCLGEAGLAALAPALSAMPGLQTLDVNGSSLDEAAGAEALCTLLSAVSGLTHLGVNYSPLGDEGAALLAPVLRGMTRLQTLNMRGYLPAEGCMATLAPALAALPHLHTLDLSGATLGATAVSMLQPVLAKKGSPLRELELNLHCAGEGGWVALAQSLSCMGPSLQALQLGPDTVDVFGAVALASALKALTGLTRLKALRVFSSAAMSSISPGLVRMRRLQVLDLSSNAMTPKDTAAFAAALPALAGSLKQLDLSYCRINSEVAAKALAQATGLVELRVNGTYFGPQGVQWLVPVLSGLPHLRKLDLCSCKLGVQGCMAIARALNDRDGVHVDLRGNGLPSGSTERDELSNMPGINVIL